MQGVVYYANYLLFAEVGRVAYLRELGIDYRRDLVDRGVDFTIGEASVRYQAPLRFDDEYDIRVRVGEIRGSSWAFEYAFDRADGLRCAEARTTQVLLDLATKRATRILPEIRTILERARAADAPHQRPDPAGLAAPATPVIPADQLHEPGRAE